MPLDLPYFVRKWQASELNERQAAQPHFQDLCEVLGVPHPTQSDEIGNSYAFEKRVTKTGTQETGYADVWKRGFFAWEYKSKGSDLNKAYAQINQYHEALDNPPLLVVCDFNRFVVHTKFENSPPRTYAFTLEDLLKNTDTATCAIPPLEVLRHVFDDPNQLRPGVAAARVTEAAAADFLRLAQRLEMERALAPNRPSKEQIAHFLMRLVFCLFADSVGLLPHHTFRGLIQEDRHSPIRFNKKLPFLFEAMSEKDGFFGKENIPHFNGGLFSDNSTIELDHADLGVLLSASQHDWSHIEPSIFGTLFERSLDAAKRSMIGAHYTSPDDILLLIEPVVIAPLKRRWEVVKQSILDALEAEGPALPRITQKANRPALELLQNWAAELTQVRILDPACGSGNFLYIALKRLLDLWHEARNFGLAHGLTIALDPIPHPGQLFGIEIDFYAHEIASIVVWIGFLQWKHDHGIKDQKEPLLQKLTNIEHADAIMRYDDAGKPYEPKWPEADYIVGNPPFLGGNFVRAELGDVYVDDLFDLYAERVERFSDLVCYWFEKARHQLELSQVERVGLLATQGIRGGANRAVLEKIQQTGRIFWAWSDRRWTLAGAAVHVSMVGFDRSTTNTGAPHLDSEMWDGAATPVLGEGGSASAIPGLKGETWGTQGPPPIPDGECELDGQPVAFINPDLTTGPNIASALRLKENEGLCFMGASAKGSFDISADVARKMLQAPANVNGRPNTDVVRPVMSGIDIVGRHRGISTIYFGSSLSETEAAQYEMPFEYVRHRVLPERLSTQRAEYRAKWWLYGRPRTEMTAALAGCERYIATPATAKHRIFVWVSSEVLCNQGTLVFTREDDYFIGVLQSRSHEAWARAQGSQLREAESGFRYTPVTTFDTFPFPYPPGTEPSEDDSPIVKAIADAARNLVTLRDHWLNPPDTPEAELKKRTLTNLYNQRPTWLDHAHRTLDEAVFAAYGWPSNLTTQQILANLLELNHQRAAAQDTGKKSRS